MKLEVEQLLLYWLVEVRLIVMNMRESPSLKIYFTRYFSPAYDGALVTRNKCMFYVAYQYFK